MWVGHLNRFMGHKMGVYGLKVHKDVWIAKNHEIKGKWMYSHRWTRKIKDAEKFSSEDNARKYADKHLLSGCRPATTPPSNLPNNPNGGTPVAVAAQA